MLGGEVSRAQGILRVALACVLVALAAPTVSASPSFGGAQRLLDRGDAKGARRVLERILAEEPDGRDAPQARYLLGLCLIETGAYEAAQKIFSELVGSYPALQEDHLYFRGEALFHWGSFMQAAEVLQRVDPNGPRGDDALRLRARALFRATDFVRLERWLEDRLHREGKLEPELLYFLGHARQRTGDVFGAHAAFREVWREAPGASFAGRALAQIAKLRADGKPLVSKVEHAAIRALGSKLAKGRAADALAALEKRLQRRPEGASLRAQVAYARGRYAESRGRLGSAAAHFTRALSVAPAPMIELRARAGLGQGRVLERLGRHHQAQAALQLVADRFGDRPEAEEALFRSAEILLARRKHKEAGERFRAVLLKNPVTPYRARCLWGLGWIQFRIGNYERARQFFASLTKKRLPAELDAASRYWLARTDSSLRLVDEARQQFREVLERHPLSYYAALAADQLAEVLPANEPVVIASEVAPSPDEVPPEVARIREHARLGLRRRARAALAELKADLDRRGGKLPAETLRAIARLHDELGQNLQARRMRQRYAREYPHTMAGADVEAAARRAHPLKFEEEIRSAAAEFAIPDALLFALVRTESAFMSRAESTANAFGLAQLIMPTAKAVARRLRAGRVSKSRLLRDPAFNVRLGAAYLRQLLDQFDGSEPMALAAYNAGPGAVNSWASYRVRKLTGVEKAGRGVGLAPAADELVEEIPVHETKTYVKAVLARARVYGRLYAAPIVALEAPSAGEVPVAVYTEPASLPDDEGWLPEPPPGVRAGHEYEPIRDPVEVGMYAPPSVP